MNKLSREPNTPALSCFCTEKTIQFPHQFATRETGLPTNIPLTWYTRKLTANNHQAVHSRPVEAAQDIRHNSCVSERRPFFLLRPLLFFYCGYLSFANLSSSRGGLPPTELLSDPNADPKSDLWPLFCFVGAWLFLCLCVNAWCGWLHVCILLCLHKYLTAYRLIYKA